MSRSTKRAASLIRREEFIGNFFPGRLGPFRRTDQGFYTLDDEFEVEGFSLNGGQTFSIIVLDRRYETDAQFHGLSRAALLRLVEQIGKDRTLPNTAQANRGRARANGSRSAKREALAKILGISASGKSLRELEAMIAKAPKGGAIYECNNTGCRFVGDKAAMARHAKTHRTTSRRKVERGSPEWYADRGEEPFDEREILPLGGGRKAKRRSTKPLADASYSGRRATSTSAEGKKAIRNAYLLATIVELDEEPVDLDGEVMIRIYVDYKQRGFLVEDERDGVITITAKHGLTDEIRHHWMKYDDGRDNLYVHFAPKSNLPPPYQKVQDSLREIMKGFKA